MSAQAKVAKNLARFRQAIAAHDRENPDHDHAYGIGLAAFDLDRLGFDDGEELWPGIRIEADGGAPEMFRVLCNGDHSAEEAQTRQDAVAAIGRPA